MLAVRTQTEDTPGGRQFGTIVDDCTEDPPHLDMEKSARSAPRIAREKKLLVLLILYVGLVS